jgi:hypothetical protein
MKYGVAVLFCSVLLIQGYSQVHLARTQVKWKRFRSARMIKAIVCEVSNESDALFRNWRKDPDDPDEWWMKFREFSGRIYCEESEQNTFWQIDIGQIQVTAVKAFGSEGELLGWRLSSRSDTLMLGNFRPDLIDPSLLSCSLGKLFPSAGQEEGTGFSLQKMLTFTQLKQGKPELETFESYSADRCPTEFRLVAAFLATWVLARELGAY